MEHVELVGTEDLVPDPVTGQPAGAQIGPDRLHERDRPAQVGLRTSAAWAGFPSRVTTFYEATLKRLLLAELTSLGSLPS